MGTAGIRTKCSTEEIELFTSLYKEGHDYGPSFGDNVVKQNQFIWLHGGLTVN